MVGSPSTLRHFVGAIGVVNDNGSGGTEVKARPVRLRGRLICDIFDLTIHVGFHATTGHVGLVSGGGRVTYTYSNRYYLYVVGGDTRVL